MLTIGAYVIGIIIAMIVGLEIITDILLFVALKIKKEIRHIRHKRNHNHIADIEEVIHGNRKF